MSIGYEEIGHAVETPEGRPVRSKRGKADRLLPLGFGSTNVAAAAGQQTLRLRPNGPFRPVRIVFAGTADEDVTFDEIRINTVPQLAASGAMPARAFSPDAVLPDFMFDTQQPGTDIEILFTSTAAAQVTVRGMLIGWYAAPHRQID